MYVMNKALEISTLDDMDTVHLCSTLHALANQSYICSKCLVTYSNRQNAKEMTDKLRRTKGCEVIGDRALHQVIQDNTHITYNTCIGNFFSSAVMMWLEAYRQFKLGVMPYNGNYMDQPNKVIEIFRVIESDFTHREEVARSKQRAKTRTQLRSKRHG